MSRFLAASIGLALGVIIGQISMILAMEPTEVMDEAFKLAGQSYRYGCTKHNGQDSVCLVEGRDYEQKLRTSLPLQ